MYTHTHTHTHTEREREREREREVDRSRPRRLLVAVSVMTMLREGRAAELQIAAVMTANNPQTTLDASSIEPELLFTTPPTD